MNKRVLVIGDLHGLNVWEKLVKEYKWDEVIFLGDYVDSFTVSDSDILKNLRNIIQFKKENSKKVTLLLGNHDIQYIWEGHGCSGRRPSMELSLSLLFNENLNLFKIVHKEGKYIFSHSGFINGWIEYHKEELEDFYPAGFMYDEIETLNDLLLSHKKDILFECGRGRGGFNKYSGPLWADKVETLNDGHLDEFIQVVGHTKVNYIEDLGHIIYCDNLEYGDGIPLILYTP